MAYDRDRNRENEGKGKEMGELLQQREWYGPMFGCGEMREEDGSCILA